MRKLKHFVLAALLVAAGPARGVELDTLIPAGIPGLGQARPLSVIGQAPGLDQPVPVTVGGASVTPQLDFGFGYDTAPSGAAEGGNFLSATPSMVVADVPAGFGAYAQADTLYLPSETAEDMSGYTVAVGEALVLPRQTISVAGGVARTAQTGFGLSTLDLVKPVSYSLGSFSLSDKLSSGLFTVTPKFSFTRAAFDSLRGENFWQIRGRTQIEYAPGGPMRLVAMVEGTQTHYQDESFDAGSYAAMAGVDDDATGLWEFRILGGAAWRQPRTGKRVVAPVVEASASWRPSEVDDWSLTAVHQIDDPDQVGAVGYTLTQGQISYTHELQRTIDFSGSFKAAHAAYFGTRLTESLFDASAQLSVHVNRSFALDLNYAFNDRQADYLRAANEHVVTVSAVWTL